MRSISVRIAVAAVAAASLASIGFSASASRPAHPASAAPGRSPEHATLAEFGGTDAPDPALPFIANLGYQVTPAEFADGYAAPQWCTAVLVAPQVVMTAWHCIQGAGSQLAQMSVRIGSNNHNSGGTVVGIDGEPYHLGTDIGLLWLDQPVSNQPVAVASQTPAIGTPTLQLGWGLDCYPGQTYPQCGPPEQLQQLQGQVVSACPALCTQTPPGTGMTGGDSGGPALISVNGSWQLVGVVFGVPASVPGQADPGNLTVYSDVTAFYAALQTILQDPFAFGMPAPGSEQGRSEVIVFS